MARGKRCSFCGTQGHTRPTCPDIRNRIQKNPDGYYGREAARKKQYRTNNPRKCSWCKESGHNRSTCGVLKDALSTQAKNCREWNHKFFQMCKKTGFGIGALLKVEVGENSSEWSRKYDEEALKKTGCYGIVISFDQRELNPRIRLTDQKAVTVRFASGLRRRVAIPESFQSLTKYPDRNERVGIITTIVGTIDGNSTMSNFSNDFLDGTIGAKNHLGL